MGRDVTEALRRSGSKRKARLSVGAALLAGTLALSACSGGGGGPEADGDALTIWTTDNLPDSMAQTEAIAADFTEASGIDVEVVGVAEDQFNQLLTSAAAAGDLPDVIGGLSLAQVRTLAANDLANTDATGAVVERLGADTFTARALEMTQDDGTQLAVPSESWAQLLYYRTDLFEKAGLQPPETYEDILAAAEALDGPDTAGFVGATAPGDAFTHQTFEHIALGNDCQMVTDAGEIAFDSPECVEALQFYQDLIGGYSVPGAQDVDTVRAAYFAGQAAMFVWSTFALDEMAGLRDDAKPTCPECTDDPAFLAKNTGIVPAIQGPSGSAPAPFGEVTSWAITVGAPADPAQQFVEYMMTDGYEPWLAIAPEGKVPVRSGTAENPTQYADAWGTLDIGVDTQGPLSDFYSDDVLSVLQAGPEDLSRWGITQGQGDLVGASLGELPVAAAVSAVTSGTDPEQAAQEAADALRTIQESQE
ncbi:extracellular solute-binding protein [Promicromonospora sp. NPDC050249]|uniref:ABC transporter substrate-binding protein n=1 Tax=Promicromonospora sp. NPDC050249 TaxID=3154743 RepID=UPI003402C3AE